MGASIALTLLTGLFGGLPERSAAKQLMTVEDAIQTTRFMLNPQAANLNNPHGAVSISPSGRRYAARLLRGDMQANGVWMELIVGATSTARDAARYERVATLFTTGLGGGPENYGPVDDTDEYSNPIRWLADDQLAFLWSNRERIRQAVRIDPRTKSVEYLTRHATHVVAFAISGSGAVIYSAQAAPRPCEAAHEDGLVITEDVDAFSLFSGELCRGTLLDRASNTEWFIQEPGSASPRRLGLDGRKVSIDNRHRIDVAPNGRHALVNLPVGRAPDSWSGYEERNLKTWIAETRRNPGDVMARNIHRLFILDLRDGSARPLWDAVSLIDNARAAWSPDGRHVALAPAFLPPHDPDPRGSSGEAGVIVNIATGQYATLPEAFPQHRVVGLEWHGNRRVAVTVRSGLQIERRDFLRDPAGQWRALRTTADSNGNNENSVRFELKQDLNTPPQLVAIEPEARAQVIIDPNPDLAQRYALGRRERVEGVLPTGESWAGLLFYPIHYSVGERYPLVIQSVYGKGRPSDEFTLYGYQEGAGVGPTKIASYPGQLLANRGIFVLHLNVTVGSAQHNTPAEAAVKMHVFEAAAANLADTGLVDASRVGLLGFSRNGYYVEYTLTHSDFEFSAAISADNWDPSYLSQTLGGYGSASEAVNGGAPFREGLNQWLLNAPAFNAHRVQAPLRMVEQSLGRYGVLKRWELFNRLRYLGKPVEFYVAPDPDHGAHVMQNPRQIAAIQQGSIDWFDFWLNGRQDPGPNKAAQYKRWRKLRELRDSDGRRSD